MNRSIVATAPAPSVVVLTVDESGEGQRLDNFLFRHLKGVPKTHVYRVIRSGEVRVNKGRAQAQTKLSLGDQVRVPPTRTAQRSPGWDGLSGAPMPLVAASGRQATPQGFEVLYEDEQLLAINKPSGMAVHGGSGLSYGVIETLRRSRPQARFLELVHRLDKDTSGVLLLALRRSALTALQAQMKARGDGAMGKVYLALVRGAWPAALKVIDLALHKSTDERGERHVKVVPADHPDGRRSISLVRVLEVLRHGDQTFSLLRVSLKTGRTHQIRVHLAHHGHPILGDARYGDFAFNRETARGPLRFDRMFLHAHELSFRHPASGEPITLCAPLPIECATLLDQLSGRADSGSQAHRAPDPLNPSTP